MSFRLKTALIALVSGLALFTVSIIILSDRVSLPQADAQSPRGPIFADGKGNPLPAGERLRLLCFPKETSTAPHLDIEIITDENGQSVSGLPSACAYVAAMRELHVQPTNKPEHGPAYWVYATNWTPGSLNGQNIEEIIIVSEENLLVLFNVVVSLAWEPGPDSTYIKELRAGLAEASAYLYDLTEGQMAFGPITIHTKGHLWPGADIRILANNSRRPAAFAGGIVPEPIMYLTPSQLDVTYKPAAIILGRYWDGMDAWDPDEGRWDKQDAYRTIIHEWGHYALFLYDEYQQADGALPVYCVCDDLPKTGICAPYAADQAPSAMSYHYNSSELWYDPNEQACYNTDQGHVHNEPDWQTLTRWAKIQGLSESWIHLPATLSDGPPLGLVQHLFDAMPRFPIYLPFLLGGDGTVPIEPEKYDEPTIHLNVGEFTGEDIPSDFKSAQPQVYVIEKATDTTPRRIIHQGTAVMTDEAQGNLGAIKLLSMREDTEVRVFYDRYQTAEITGDRFIFPPYGDSGRVKDGQVVDLTAGAWLASLNIDPQRTADDLFNSLVVTLTSEIPLSSPPTVQLCVPDKDIGCLDDPAWRQSMIPLNPQVWTATLKALGQGELPLYGVLHVEAEGVGELMTWYQDIGGLGPAHNYGEAPMLDGPVSVKGLINQRVNASGAKIDRSSRVIISPVINHNLVKQQLPDNIQQIVGIPLNIDILLPDDIPTGTFAVSTYYSQDLIDQIDGGQGSIEDNRLVKLRFDLRQNGWNQDTNIGEPDRDQNWLTTYSFETDTIFVIGLTK